MALSQFNSREVTFCRCTRLSYDKIRKGWMFRINAVGAAWAGRLELTGDRVQASMDVDPDHYINIPESERETLVSDWIRRAVVSDVIWS
jgi:hypothetical protein